MGAVWSRLVPGGQLAGRVDFRPFVELWHRDAPTAGTAKSRRRTIDERSLHRRDGTTTFDEREKSFEKKFALNEELKFRSEQRRNKLLGEWAEEAGDHRDRR